MEDRRRRCGIRSRGCRSLVAALLLGFAVATPTVAQTPDVLRYLGREPATLLDLGLRQFREDLGAAARPLADPDYPQSPPRAGVFYSWREGGLQAYVTFPKAVERRTAGECRTLYRSIVDTVTGYGPRGGRVSRYLEGIFGHQGPRHLAGPRPRDLGDKIEDVLTFTVTLTGNTTDQRYGDHYVLRCTGPFGLVEDSDIRIGESGT